MTKDKKNGAEAQAEIDKLNKMIAGEWVPDSELAMFLLRRIRECREEGKKKSEALNLHQQAVNQLGTEVANLNVVGLQYIKDLRECVRGLESPAQPEKSPPKATEQNEPAPVERAETIAEEEDLGELSDATC